jgi:D-beta-D-heptose 7-phosphate kinase/D-beta-D-heptose 1-phosphate adenosyltransferase
MRVGLTSGVFDLVHYGHLVYLERCKAHCDTLIVGVDSDAMVKAAKGPTRPLIPELERLQMIQALEQVDAAFLVRDLEDLERMVLSFNVGLVFKHEGFRTIEGPIIGVEGTQAELCIIPDVPGLRSTTEIINEVLRRVEPGM